jgi:hypothetical protein
MDIADYGENGHGEVVGMSIPKSSIPAFAKEYIGLFGTDGDRPDKVRHDAPPRLQNRHRLVYTSHILMRLLLCMHLYTIPVSCVLCAGLQGDRGLEYRSLIGLPGGIKNDQIPAIEAAAKTKGLRLVEGKGNDPDTLFKRVIYVMDTEKFPFYQAELYHQFHDGFMPGEQYPEKYNSLAKAAYAEGRLEVTGCPDSIPK